MARGTSERVRMFERPSRLEALRYSRLETCVTAPRQRAKIEMRPCLEFDREKFQPRDLFGDGITQNILLGKTILRSGERIDQLKWIFNFS